MNDLISRQKAIDAILAVTGNSSVRELYEHVQEHGLSDMWSGGVNAAIDIIIALPSAQPDLCDGCDRYEVSCVGEGCGKLEVPKEEHTEERTETHACEKEKKAMNDDAKFHGHILAEICDYAVQQGMDPDEMGQIQFAPTIDPFRKGKWIPLQLSMAHPPYQCSCCFRNAPMVETGCLVNRHLEALLTDWCPWCGAKMEGCEQDG